MQNWQNKAIKNRNQQQMIYEGKYFLLISDSRVKDWPMMQSPLPTLSICIFYVYFCKSLAPRLMEKREAFNLRNTLIFYNLFQTVFSTWIFYEVSYSGGFSSFCKDHSSNFSSSAVSAKWMVEGLQLQVSTCWLQSERPSDGGDMLVVLHLQIYRIFRHLLLLTTQEESTCFDASRDSPWSNAI